MRSRAIVHPLLSVALSAGIILGAEPVWPQSLSHGFSQNQEPSRQQIEQFCASYSQMSGSQRKQYRAQYEEYCERRPLQPETTIIQPSEPLTGQQQPQQQPQEPSQQQPEEPEPEEPAPEPEIQPAKPEPVIPEPEPARVDLAGELRLDGPLARQAGDRQRFRLTVMNRGEDPPRGGRLWAEVFLSERDVSRRRGSAFSLPAVQRGRSVRIPGIPGPGREREVMTQATVPATVEAGEYWWCVRVDSRQAVQETDEGNNTACARKVVALGKERDSELSGLFGSKVDEVRGSDEAGQRPAYEPKHPGILRQAELDRLEDMLAETGGTSYVIFSGQHGAGLTGESKRGLLLMRRSDDLTPLGGDYYKDGRGNLVLFGDLPGDNGAAPYALTLLAGGGLQLVVDMDRDGVVDAGVSEGLKDRFGFLARPGLEGILDCMNQAVTGGAGPVGEFSQCLTGESSGDDSSGGTGGSAADGGLGSHLDAALEPQCGSEDGIGSPGGVTQPGSDDSKPFDEQLRDAAENHRDNADYHRDAAQRAGKAGDEDLESRHRSAAREEQRLAQKADQAAADYEFVRKVAGDENASGEDVVDAMAVAADSAEAYREARDNRSSAPGPDGTAPAGASDPRCEEPTMWNRFASEQCASNMTDCLKRMSDPIYAATGGRCETVTGPDDAERVECKGNDSVARCIEGGGTPQECAEKHAGDGGGAAPSPDDDIFRNDRGELTYGVMDVHPFGATLAAMCRKAGGIGPCGDPSPAVDDRIKGVRSAAPEASR